MSTQHKVRARRFSTVPNEPLTRRTSWPQAKVRPQETYPSTYEIEREKFKQRLEYQILQQVPKDDPGYDGDIEDNRRCFWGYCRTSQRRDSSSSSPH